MGIIRKILIFLVITSGIIYLGKLAPKVVPLVKEYLPASWTSSWQTGNQGAGGPMGSGPRAIDRTPGDRSESGGGAFGDTSNALPEILEDTNGGRWHEKLFSPLLRANGLNEKNLKQKKGYWELMLPKGKPIHEYALQI